MIIITIIKKNPSSKCLCRFAKSYYCNDPKGLSKQCRHTDQTALRGFDLFAFLSASFGCMMNLW